MAPGTPTADAVATSYSGAFMDSTGIERAWVAGSRAASASLTRKAY